MKNDLYSKIEIKRAYLAQFNSPQSCLGYFSLFEYKYTLDSNPFIYPYLSPVIEG